MRIALAQMNSIAGDKARNLERAVGLIGEAAKGDADLVLLPEFFNTEYFAQYRDYSYLDYAEPLDGPSLTAVSEAARQFGVWVIATIYEEDRPGFLYDTAAVIDRHGIRRGEYRKTHPAASYSLEKIYFRPGSHFPIFNIEGWPTGIMICYDTSFPEVARILALNGADLILAPFASPKHPLWRSRHQNRALENTCFLAACNKVGHEGEWTFAGESLVAAPDGELLAVGSGSEEEIVFADIDRERVREVRREYPMFRDRRPDLYQALVTPTEDLQSR